MTIPSSTLHPVYIAINSICEVKGSASYAEIASVAGIKKQKALDFIIRNKHLLRMNKSGKVLGFISHESNVRRIVKGLYSFGEVYTTSEINYGADKQILCHGMHAEKVKHLVGRYYCGGIGDSYPIDIILLTDENKKALEDLGIRDYEEVVKEKLDKGENQVWNDWCSP